jgi:hypothetical protein
MALNIEKTIDLTSYDGNSNPKIVNQLSLIHEAEEGELVQYYIDQTSKTEGDKNSHAIGILIKSEQQSTYYEYKNYDEIQWSLQKSRITRQKIDRLGVKAFPDVGAIAFYKLMYRNRCKILAPVNPKWAQDRVIAPQIRATLGEGNRSVTFTIIDPDDDNIQFSCYRINMVLDYHQLEYVTYEKEVTIDYVPVDGLYSCYCIGYVNEGEICSKDSNVLELQMIGQYSTWPIVTPGSEIPKSLEDLIDTLITNKLDRQVLQYDSSSGLWRNKSIPFTSENTQIENPVDRQLLRFDGVDDKWKNFTSSDPRASDSESKIVDVKILGSKKLQVEVDGRLKNSIENSAFVVTQSGTNFEVVSSVSDGITIVTINLQEALSSAFSVQLLKEAFKSENNDTNVFNVNVSFVDLSTYTDTTDEMTNASFSSDDGSSTFTVPSEFSWIFGSNRISSLVISGNSWIGLGSSTEHIKVNRRDCYISTYYHQLIETGMSSVQKVLKIRWEGWAPYGSRDDNHKFIWELFLLDNGDAYLHLVSKASSTSWDGTFTFVGLSYTLNDSVKDVTFKRVGEQGTASADWQSEQSSYIIFGN